MLRTRSVRPVEPITYTSQEMMTSLFSAIHPSCIVSLNQMHGDRKGVVRISFKNVESVKDFENKLAGRKIHINGTRLAMVTDSGQFVKATLLDVPEYLNSGDIEHVLREYGSVAHVKREYLDFKGHKLENETRLVLFSRLDTEIPGRIKVDGNEILVTCRPVSRKEDMQEDVKRPSRPVSRQSGSETSSRGIPQNKESRRAASPLVTPETERLPDLTSERPPRDRIMAPEPTRRSAMSRGKTPTSPPGGGLVAAEVQTEEKRGDRAEGAWVPAYSTPTRYRQYEEQGQQEQRNYDSQRDRAAESKI